MDNQNGGLDPSARQRKTAAEIARKKVLESYAGSPQEHSKNSETRAKITKEEWSKYHSAWQNYYQKYYSEYYSKAARNYIATQKLKQQRAIEDDRKLLEDEEIKEVPEPAKEIGTIITVKPTLEETESNLRTKIQKKATERIKKSKKHRHLVPILAGVCVVLIFLFLQYNRLIFAPIAAYVSPGDNAATSITPISAEIPVSEDNKLLIPKLNIDVPVHFGISNDTKTVMDAMNNGVAHFAIPGANALPGEIGNLIITGHSAGDVYSNNKYKFIFSGLERLSENDTIYINYNSKRYVYSVTSKEIVEPTDIASLTKSTGKPMLTLVTCTPLGTSRYRLLVHAEQISPSTETASTTEPSVETSQSQQSNILPANEVTFFENIWNFLTGRS